MSSEARHPPAPYVLARIANPRHRALIPSEVERLSADVRTNGKGNISKKNLSIQKKIVSLQ